MINKQWYGVYKNDKCEWTWHWRSCSYIFCQNKFPVMMNVNGETTDVWFGKKNNLK